MRRLIPSVAALSAAFLTLLLFAGAVRSGAPIDRAGPGPAQPVISFEHTWPVSGYRAGPGSVQSAPEYSRTRIVTITVGTTVPLGLSSRWQINTLDQRFFTGTITLQSDASDITVTLVNGEYSINFAAPPTIWFTNSQGLYYEYSTDQQARRFGNQILISQTYRYNYPLHYVETVIFPALYEYVGYSGYAPTYLSATRQLHWDESFPEKKDNRFEAAAWLVDPAASRPDLEIVDARVVDRQLNRIYVTATIHNNGGTTAGAPAFVNLYDRLALSEPAGPLDLAGGWCTLDPTRCGDSRCNSVSNRLPALVPDQTVIFTADCDLSAIDGQHYIYLYVDALGVVNALGNLGNNEDLGLNYESEEGNNSTRLVLMRGDKEVPLIRYGFVFLPLIRRG
jgi:hypothetical protein